MDWNAFACGFFTCLGVLGIAATFLHFWIIKMIQRMDKE